MAKVLYASDTSMLKHAILKMWDPVAGVKTVAEFWKRNAENFLAEVPRWRRHVYKEFVKQVASKRKVEDYFDVHPPFQLSEPILTGSLSDGLFLFTSELSDMDFMCVLKNINFTKEDQKCGGLSLREDTPFLYAFTTNKETQNMWSEYLDEKGLEEGKYRLSSKKLKEKLRENYQKKGNMFSVISDREQLEEVSEGAAITVRRQKPASMSFLESIEEIMYKTMRQPLREMSELNMEKEYGQIFYNPSYKMMPSSDIVLAIFCHGWPSCAREWITRERSWPDIHAVEEIAQSGFHIVPKSSPDGDFRLSFSCAEAKLVETLSPLQHKVMRAFKAAVKYHENAWRPNMVGVISSYYLKTTAFWYFEKTSMESWSEETLVYHLVSLLDKLADALRNQNLPMYFMPKVNLLQNVHDPEVVLDLLEKISELCHDFPAICKAIENTDFLRVFGDEKDYIAMLRNVLKTLDAEIVKKREEGKEVPFTLFDFFYVISEVTKKSIPRLDPWKHNRFLMI